MVSNKTQVNLLTARETELMDLLSTGMGNEEIAQSMFLSINTVRSHLKRISDKLLWSERHTRTQLAVWWIHYKYAVLRGAAVAVVNSGVMDLDHNIDNLRLALAPVVDGPDAPK